MPDTEASEPLGAPNPGRNAGAKWLKVTSPCQGSVVNYAPPVINEDSEQEQDAELDGETWRGFCACCKRPLSFSVVEQQPQPSKRRCLEEDSSGDRYAYVVALWGSNAEYVLGAAVLGWSLWRTGTPHDLVALHTDDVPAGAIEMLRRSGWIPRRMEYVEAADTLYQEHCLKMRFAKVFTKLRVFELVEYSKVLLLDADLLVTKSIDDLFEIQAPAAMARGPWAGYKHGERINGRYFFAGYRPGGWSWGQSSGINAGVMLLKPSLETFAQCVQEISDANHPEHIRGNGPEQDYLSRYFASDWSHIDVANNFQIHQMYFALSPRCEGADRAKFIEQSDLIKVFHYSSEPKPWARFLEKRFQSMSDEEWCHEIKQEFSGYRAWVMKDVESMNCELERSGTWGVAKDAHGVIRWITGDERFKRSAEDAATSQPPPQQDSADTKNDDADGKEALDENKTWRQEIPEADTKGDQDKEADADNGSDDKNIKMDAVVAGNTADIMQAKDEGKVETLHVDNKEEPDTEWAHKHDYDNWYSKKWKGKHDRWHDDQWDWTRNNWRENWDKTKDDRDYTDNRLRSEEGWILGDELEISEAAVRGAEEVTRRSLVLWEEAYRELQAYLKEDDLAAAVKASMEVHTQWVAKEEDHGSDGYKGIGSNTGKNNRIDSWGPVKGWWVERPLEGRAVASCAVVPSPSASLLYNSKPLLTAQCAGLHLAAVPAEGTACPSPRTFPTLESMSGIGEWLDEVPEGSFVTLAIVDPAGDLAAEALAALACGGLGCPRTPPPEGYLALAAVGKKGESSWHDTHAAPDIALATTVAR